MVHVIVSVFHQQYTNPDNPSCVINASIKLETEKIYILLFS